MRLIHIFMYEFIFLKGTFMTLYTIITLAVGLAMDAFTVSISKGMCINKFNIYKFFIIAFYFGFFQAFMPPQSGA